MALNANPLKTKREGKTYAQKRREERKLALRDYVEGQQYLIAINRDLDRNDITTEELPVIKFKTETRLKLLNKVLPDLKAMELSGNAEKPVWLALSNADADL